MIDPIAVVLRASLHTFMGRVGREVEVRYFENGNAVANVSIAVNRPGSKRDDGQEPDWLKLELWGERAQDFADTVSKGDLVTVTGRVKTERWTVRATGEERMGLAVIVSEWALVPRADRPPLPQQQGQPAAPAPAPAGPPDTDDIPF